MSEKVIAPGSGVEGRQALPLEISRSIAIALLFSALQPTIRAAGGQLVYSYTQALPRFSGLGFEEEPDAGDLIVFDKAVAVAYQERIHGRLSVVQETVGEAVVFTGSIFIASKLAEAAA
jgi:hypothetical protein